MADSLMHNENHYVVLETNQAEQFLSAEEMLAKLCRALSQIPPAELPREVGALPTVEAQAQRLLDTVCELDVGPGEFLQWYAVRLEK